MSGSEWLEFQYRLITVLAFLSLFCNAVLILLIHLKSPKKLGPYKYLMNFISIFEVCYSIIDYLVIPVMHSHGPSFFIMTPLAHSFFNDSVALIMLAVWCGLFGSSMAVFGIHFIYRYLAVSGSEKISTFKGNKIMFWMLIPVIYGTIWGTISFFCCGPKEVMTNFIRNNLMEDFNLSVDEVVYIGPYFYTEDGKFLLDIDVVVTLTAATAIMDSSLMTIFYFGWKCYKSLSGVHAGGFSKQFRTLQRQFFTALVLQTVIPITLMHLPLLITYSGALLNISLGNFSNLTSITIALYPVIDPLPTIFIIKNYREGLKKFCLTPIKFFLKIKNKDLAKIGHADDASSRRTSKAPEDDNVSAWGHL